MAANVFLFPLVKKELAGLIFTEETLKKSEEGCCYRAVVKKGVNTVGKLN